MQNARLDDAQAGIKIARRNMNNLSYADDTTLMAESKEEPQSLLMKTAVSLAAPGDTVLLSPATASMDMFRDYRDRGDQFKDLCRKFASSASPMEQTAK